MDLCVVVEGATYLVDVNAPAQDAKQPLNQVMQVAADADRLILVSFSAVAAVNRGGVAWRAEGLGLDGIRIVSTTADQIVCSIDDLDGSSHEVALDPLSGQPVD
jgi:hypothetical protein